MSMQCVENFDLANRLSKFSSWSRAVRAVARLQRRASKDKSNHLSTVLERREAELYIINCLQNSIYYNEIKEIKTGTNVSLNSVLYPLDAFMSEEGLLRVGGSLP